MGLFGGKRLFLWDVEVLVATRSRSRSDSPPDCHPLRSRRFVTHALAVAKASLYDLRRPSVSEVENLFCYTCEKVLEGVWGNFSKEVPPQSSL